MQKSYGCEVDILLKDLEEYDMEVERPTIIMILETDPNTIETDQIGMYVIYQSDITYCIKMSIYFKKDLRNSYTVIWELCKQKAPKLDRDECRIWN